MVNIRLTKAKASSHTPSVFIEIDQDKIPELQHPLLHLMHPLQHPLLIVTSAVWRPLQVTPNRMRQKGSTSTPSP